MYFGKVSIPTPKIVFVTTFTACHAKAEESRRIANVKVGVEVPSRGEGESLIGAGKNEAPGATNGPLRVESIDRLQSEGVAKLVDPPLISVPKIVLFREKRTKQKIFR